jgi:SAM-dependent methyltransferase
MSYSESKLQGQRLAVSTRDLRDLRDLLVCPACHGTLVWGAEISCAACSSQYGLQDGIPVLVAQPADGVKARQAAWFDEEVDPEYEIERPAGTPAFHRWLLGEKFRRSIEAIKGELHDASALCVCAGSGMDAEFLAHAGARVISADISLGAALRAKERARRHGLELMPIVADAERLPFADRSIDLVYVHDGLHHLERPVAGLGEMARVARRAVSITEPAHAAVTRLSVLIGISGDIEEAGNRVERVVPAELEAELRLGGFDIVRRQRYAMFYRHEPGRSSRVLSRPVLFPLAQLAFRAGNAILGPIGNKLTLQAVRRP